MQQAFGLTQRPAKEQAERECGLDGEIGIERLPAALSGLGSCLYVDGCVTAPERHVAAIAQRSVILDPVLDAVGGFVVRMAVGLFVGLSHGGHRWLSEFVMAPA